MSRIFIINFILMAVISSNMMAKDGNKWISIASESAPFLNPTYYSATSYNGKLYVAFSDTNETSKFKVFEYDNSKWRELGSNVYYQSGIGCLSIDIYNGIPFVAFEAGMMKLSDNKWEYPGSIRKHDKGNGVQYVEYYKMLKDSAGKVTHMFRSGFSDGDASHTSLKIDKNGVPYIAFSESGNHYRISVMKLMDNDFTYVGKPGFSGGQAGYIQLEFDADNVPYVIFSERSVSVMKYTGKEWVYIGKDMSIGRVRSCSIAFDNNVPYIAFCDGRNPKFDDWNNKWAIIVLKYCNQKWQQLGNELPSGETDMSLKIKRTVPYLAFQDGGKNLNGKASVVKFENNKWEYVGQKGFSSGRVFQVNLVFNNDLPYVLCKEGNVKETLKIYQFE